MTIEDLMFDRPIFYGLTGGMGSGKSTVARHFTEKGARLIDADQVVRDLQIPGSPMLNIIESVLGEGIIVDGALNRQAVADRIFTDRALHEQFMAAIDPVIYREIGRRAMQMSLGEVVIIDIPLLKEKNKKEIVLDGIIVVDTPTDLALQRLEEGRGISAAEAQRRLSYQMDRDQRLQLADYVITNDGSSEQLQAQVDEVYRALSMERCERFIDTLEPFLTPDKGSFVDLRPHLLAIVSLYGGDSRFYHDLTHLEEMANFLRSRLGVLKRPKGVLAGMIAHDAVYNAGAYAIKGQNEKSSWSAVDESFSTFYNASTLEVARNCTLATIDHLNHPVGVDSDIDIFLDADMAVLASDWERFQKYELGIFKEFTYTPGGELRISREDYVRGRLKFLKSLLGKPIFRTSGMEEEEHKVQDNLVQMITLLENEATQEL